jgi:flagellar hook assembly protein FlgD
VWIDTVPATLASTAVPSWFSPNGDGRSDRTTLKVTADSTITGSARLISNRGVVVRSFPIGATTAAAWTWDGKDSAGRIVKDGPYIFRVEGADAAGNPTVRDMTVRVDRTIRSVTWASSSFRPAAGRTDRLGFSIIRPATVSVAIYQGSVLVRSIWTNRAVAAGSYGWTWNGRNTSGARVKAGTYTAVVTATSWIGPTKYTRTVRVSP